MSQILSKILRDAVDGNGDKLIHFFCPGCKSVHGVYVTGNHAWGWNGNVGKPTFTPSVLVRSGHFIPGKSMDGCWCRYNAEHPDKKPDFTCGVCHSFVTDGNIQFLGDCTHELAGQTVPLPEWS